MKEKIKEISNIKHKHTIVSNSKELGYKFAKIGDKYIVNISNADGKIAFRKVVYTGNGFVKDLENGETIELQTTQKLLHISYLGNSIDELFKSYPNIEFHVDEVDEMDYVHGYELSQNKEIYDDFIKTDGNVSIEE